MSPEKQGGDVYYSIPEASNTLGITRQAVYSAVTAGHMKATEGPQGKRIHAQDLIGYGLRRGREPKELLESVQKESGADLSDLLLWVLAGLGLFYLFKTFLGDK